MTTEDAHDVGHVLPPQTTLAWSQGARLCQLGYHAWTPWFQLPNTSFVTICGREGCLAERQYDL